MTGEHVVKFAPNQKLPPGYTVQWWDSDEHYHWVLDEDTYSCCTCCRFSARRGAWAHYNKQITTMERSDD